MSNPGAWAGHREQQHGTELAQPERHPGRGKAEGLSVGSSWSLQEVLSPVSLVKPTFLFHLQNFGIFISLCHTKCKIISAAAPAAGWLASQLLLVSKVVEVAGWVNQQSQSPLQCWQAGWARSHWDLGWAGAREAPRASLSQCGSGLRCAGTHLRFQG